MCVNDNYKKNNVIIRGETFKDDQVVLRDEKLKPLTINTETNVDGLIYYDDK